MKPKKGTRSLVGLEWGQLVYLPSGTRIEVQADHEPALDWAVRAINAHEALVEALRLMLEQHGYKGRQPQLPQGYEECPCVGCFFARAALAKAESKSNEVQG